MSFLNRGPRNPIGLTALATLLGLASGRMIPGPHGDEFPEERTRSLAYINKYRPHQGKRECARRRGGSAWIAYRNADRQRRGLPIAGGFVQ